MNIEGIGEEIVVILYQNGWVNDIADLYDLHTHRTEIEALRDSVPRTADRMIDGIEASRQVPFERVMYALSIPFVGETVAKKLARSLGDIDSVMNAGVEALTAIDDIGPRIAESVQEYFNNPVNRDIIERLRRAECRCRCPNATMPTAPTSLAGKSIVISGTFSKHSRDEYKDMIERHGRQERKFDFQEDRLPVSRRKHGSREVAESDFARHSHYRRGHIPQNDRK